MDRPLAILFDVGDTLIEYHENNPLKGTEELLKWANNPHSITADEIQKYAVEMGKDFNKARENGGIEFTMRSFQRFLYEMHNISFKLKPLEVENIFNKFAFRGQAMPEALEFLDFLEEQGIRKAILSNSTFSEEAIREELRSYGIDDKRFEFVISTSEYGFRKPDKRIFELALKKLNLQHNQVWYIGNSFRYDVIGAQNAKIFSIWFNKQNNVGEKLSDGLEVKSFDDIKKYLI
ncbi:HAD family hydrolase [uncultured Clostridium sp.]|uniref:HAD family hydrolase n=1 Tax=uncultured Clostridium sp. TaxID=59620 RepID=UPI00261F724B|nr:HAD family hydrolase [uncultured Clostridium sp.]